MTEIFCAGTQGTSWTASPCITLHHLAPHRTTPHHTAPHRTTPHRTTPHHTAPHRTTPHHTAPHHTAPHHSAPHHTTLHRIKPRHTNLPVVVNHFLVLSKSECHVDRIRKLLVLVSGNSMPVTQYHCCMIGVQLM